MILNNLWDELYRRLLDRYGYQYWWPLVQQGKSVYPEDTHKRSRHPDEIFEIALGAILTQNTAWKNVERAISGLQENRLMSYQALSVIEAERLAEIIKPAGYFNQKTKKIKAWIQFIAGELNGRIENLSRFDLDTAREKLLSVWGIGRETADSILCYGLYQPVFVVDAYTRRIFSRLGWLNGDEDYDVIRGLTESRLDRDDLLYREYHALLVRHAVDACRKKPICGECPVIEYCKFNSNERD